MNTAKFPLILEINVKSYYQIFDCIRKEFCKTLSNRVTCLIVLTEKKNEQKLRRRADVIEYFS